MTGEFQGIPSGNAFVIRRSYIVSCKSKVFIAVVKQPNNSVLGISVRRFLKTKDKLKGRQKLKKVVL